MIMHTIDNSKILSASETHLFFRQNILYHNKNKKQVFIENFSKSTCSNLRLCDVIVTAKGNAKFGILIVATVGLVYKIVRNTKK